jgi:hypothetical protein
VLVLEILEKLHLLELAVERSRLTGLPPDRVDASISAFDFLYLVVLALEELERLDLQAAQVAKLRALWGMSRIEVADVLGVSRATVERDWRFARTWLAAHL